MNSIIDSMHRPKGRAAALRVPGATAVAFRWLLAIASASALFAAPSTAATLSGFIRDSANREALAFATVIVTPDTTQGVPAGGTAAARTTGALSNGEGYYSVPRLAPGRYLVGWQYVGYRFLRDTLEVGLDDIRKDVLLVPEPLQSEVIEVTAKANEKIQALQPGFVGLDAKALRRLPAVGEQDIIRSLQMLPGIQAASDVSTGLYIRGGGPDQTLILLDQIPLYNPTHAFGIFSTFNPDAIKDVNLYKGAYPAQYGGRLGSVLDVSNRAGNKNKFEGHGGVSVIAARLTLEGPIEHGSWIVSGRRTYLDPLLSALRKSSSEVPAYYFYDLNGRVNRSFGTGNTLTLSGYRGSDDVRVDLDENSFIDINWGNFAGTAKWTHVFHPSLFGNFLLAGSQYKSETGAKIFDTPLAFGNKLVDLSAKADLDWHATQDHFLAGGLTASSFRFSYNQEFNRETQNDVEETPYAYAIYAQDQWTATDRLTLQPGMHARYFSEGADWSLEPRISGRYLYRPDWKIKFGGGLYSQYLQLITTEGFSGGDIWVPLDSSVKNGRSWQTVLGLEHEPSEAYSYSLETYYTGLRHLVTFDNKLTGDADDPDSEELFISEGKGWAAGTELFLQKRTGDVTGWLGYTLGYSRRKWGELNQGNTFPPKYDRRHDFKFTTTYKRGRWSYNVNFVYATGQAFTPAGARYRLNNPGTDMPPQDDLLLPAPKNSARLTPFHRLDVSATKEAKIFGLKGEWYFQIFNLYSHRNDWFVQYDSDEPTAEPKIVRQFPIIPTLGVNFEF